MVVILWKESTEALITRFRDAGFRSAERRCRPLLYRLNRRIYHLYHVRATRRKRVICNCSSCLATISSVSMPASRYQWGRNWRQILSQARLKRPFFTNHFFLINVLFCLWTVSLSSVYFTNLHSIFYVIILFHFTVRFRTGFSCPWRCDAYVLFMFMRRSRRSLRFLRFPFPVVALLVIPMMMMVIMVMCYDGDGTQAVWYIALTWTSC